MSSNTTYSVAVVGATGAVGREMLSILQERRFPVGSLRLLASARSKGTKLRFHDTEVVVEELTASSFEGVDIALFSAGSSISRSYAPKAATAGAVVIDNSSAFRLEPDVPLVVPEVNPHDIKGVENRGIIANPNCTTAITVMALKPIHDLSPIRRVVATSFQAVSGAGAQAIAELEQQVKAWCRGERADHSLFPHPIAFNLIPHIDSFLENGYTREEMKLHNETRKILGDRTLMVTATTVRVPVFRTHCISVNVETAHAVAADEARRAMERFPGLEVMDDPASATYPTPLEASYKDDCLVGRIREDYSHPNTLNLWVAGDQLRKGAALNAVQIAELLVENHV